MRQVVTRAIPKNRRLLAISAAVGLVAVGIAPAEAANLTWTAGTNGTWVNGGGSFGGPVWNNDTPDVFIHNSALRSQITLNTVDDPDLVAQHLQNSNGGILRMDMGSLTITSAGDNLNFIGRSGGTGAFYQDGGIVDFSTAPSGKGLMIGSGGNASGFYQLADGNLNLGERFLSIARTPFGTNNDVGVFYQSGGTVTASAGFEIANQGTNNHAVYYMTDGTYTASSGLGKMVTASNSTSQLTITNATMASTNTGGNVGLLDMANGNVAGQTSVVNLNAGGVLQVTRIRAEGGAAHETSVRHVNFNGGTLRDIRPAGGDLGAPLLSGPSAGQYYSTYVYAGGATFDIQTAGYTANVSGPLLAPTGSGVSGTTYALTGLDRGSGYIGAPVVLIDGATGATAVANMEDDETGNGTFRVASITITNPGINADDVPTYSFVGGGATSAAAGGNLNTAPNVSGGVTKIGLGALNLNSANTYTGETRIEAGTLALGATGDLSASSAVNVLEGAIFNASGKSGAVVKGLKGAGQVTSRNDATVANRLLVQNLLAPGDNGVGTLTIANGDLRVGDGAVYEYEIGGTTASPTSDLIDITLGSSGGDLTFDGDWTLKLANLGTVDPTGMTFVLFDYTSGAHPTLGTVTIDYGSTNWAGGLVSIDTTNRMVILTDLEVIPEPSALALIGLAALPMLRRRRR